MPSLLLSLEGAAAPLPVELDRRDLPEGGVEFALRAGEGILAGAAALDAEGEGYLCLGARRVPFYAVRVGDSIEVWLGGEVYRFGLARPRGRGPGGALPPPPGGRIEAPMPGLILKVLATPGQRVDAQSPLVVMESMKMELTVAAPSAGRVVEVECEPGQLVDLGASLLRLEPEETP